MAGTPLDPAADFKDDGGTPQFRARQRAARMAPVWAVIRFIWLFPIVAIGIWMWQSGAWAHAEAVRRSLGAG